MGIFEQELSRNSDSGSAYIFGKEGSDFEDYDMTDITAQLQRWGHEIVQTVFESRVIDVDDALVVRNGIVKVKPALSSEELGSITQETGFSAEPILH